MREVEGGSGPLDGGGVVGLDVDIVPAERDLGEDGLSRRFDVDAARVVTDHGAVIVD